MMSPRPWAQRRSFRRDTSSFSSRTNRLLGSSLITALQRICLARSAYLWVSGRDHWACWLRWGRGETKKAHTHTHTHTHTIPNHPPRHYTSTRFCSQSLLLAKGVWSVNLMQASEVKRVLHNTLASLESASVKLHAAAVWEEKKMQQRRGRVVGSLPECAEGLIVVDVSWTQGGNHCSARIPAWHDQEKHFSLSRTNGSVRNSGI